MLLDIETEILGFRMKECLRRRKIRSLAIEGHSSDSFLKRASMDSSDLGCCRLRFSAQSCKTRNCLSIAHESVDATKLLQERKQ